MGLVLDSSVLIAAERAARPVSEVLMLVERDHRAEKIVLSSVTVMELEHGFHRAGTAALATKRRRYLDTVFAAIPVEPFTHAMAALAAKIDAEAKRSGKVIPLADLLIGATALEPGYGVGTVNLRHFRMIPGLQVVPL